MGIKECIGLVVYQVGGFDFDVGIGNWELYVLVYVDGMIEDYVFFGISVCFVDELVVIVDVFGGDQGMFGVEVVEDVFEIVFFFVDQVFGGDFQVVEEKFIGFMIDYIQNGLYFQFFVDGFFQIDQED